MKAVRDIIFRLIAVAITKLVVVLALRLTGAHGNSTRFAIVLKTSFLALSNFMWVDPPYAG